MRTIFIIFIFVFSLNNVLANGNTKDISLSKEDEEIIQNIEILQELDVLTDIDLLEDYEAIKDIETLGVKGETDEENDS